MAPKNAEKRNGLTLEKLASFDDIITDALVDKVYYWTTIRKNRGGRFAASRGLHEEEIADTLRKSVIYEKDPAEAVQRLLQLPGLRKFVNGLKDERDKEQFTRHLKKYIHIYMPDCPFEVTTTNRYMISEHEASVTARKDIRKGEEIKYLTGVQVAMTEEQEKSLELARKDFSLVISSRKKTRSLFLGPARFANHDCDANSRLSTKGYDGMQVVATKNIAVGDEITVSYGEDYFGDDNEECLCNTCESKLVNGWAPFKPKDDDDDDDDDDEEEEEEEEEEGEGEKMPVLEEKPTVDEEQTPTEDEGSYALRRKRKLESTSSPTTSDGDSPSPSKRSKTNDGESQASPQPTPDNLTPTSPIDHRSSHSLRHVALKKTYSMSSLRQEVPITSIEGQVTDLVPSPRISREIRTQQRVGLLTVTLDEMTSSRDTTPLSTAHTASPKSSQSTDATSIDEDAAVKGSSETIKLEPDAQPGEGLKPNIEITTTKTKEWSVLDDTTSELSELSSSQELDDVLRTVVKKRKRSKTPALLSFRATRSSSRLDSQIRLSTPVTVSPPSSAYIPNPRQPGDYINSDALLSAKYSRWVECNTCDNSFVQADAYQIRKECPRCERHSKLYGFAWPKTDREGKWDTEERVLDHRTVHRFIDPEEQKEVKKAGGRDGRGRGKARLSTPREVSRSVTRETSVLGVQSGRVGKRGGRKTM